jgi:hypothetical protein
MVVAAALGVQIGVAVGVGVLVEDGVLVGEPFGVGVAVATGVPVGGGPTQTFNCSNTVGVGVGLVLLLPPPQLKSITEPIKSSTGASTNDRRTQSIGIEL